ncbi:unnamed protein product, partial [Protopolystoma xenopodis]
ILPKGILSSQAANFDDESNTKPGCPACGPSVDESTSISTSASGAGIVDVQAKNIDDGASCLPQNSSEIVESIVLGVDSFPLECTVTCTTVEALLSLAKNLQV